MMIKRDTFCRRKGDLLNGEAFEELLHWQRAKPTSRIVTFYVKGNHTEAWVYDYDLSVGQFVTSAAEIDLEKVRTEQLEELIAKLKSRSVTDQLYQ